MLGAIWGRWVAFWGAWRWGGFFWCLWGVLVWWFVFKGVLGLLLALVPQVLLVVLALYLISASALQCSMYICYSTTNRERLDLKKLMNYLLNDIFICFLLVLAGSYLKATLGIEFIRLFNLM